ncbi:MAG: MFS transporter [Opitutaceae bacterium]|jgi:ACS family hexuronate transporter-like MFS transporter|nr:MFS transporter [Opitutaceae bacterium]
MKIPHFRWWIITLIFLAAVLNYVDRQTLSALAPTIQLDLDMDDRAYADIVNIFLVAYTISYLVSGRLIDRLGTRAGMAVFVAWWSVANMLTAAAHGMRSLGAFRFALGLGEAGVWPAASKAVSEWFPARERALAIGLYTMGSTIGATVAPYIVIPLAQFPYVEKLPFLARLLGNGAGWRMAFLITGALGLLWLIPWTSLYRAPRQSRFVTGREVSLIEEPEPGAKPAVAAPASTNAAANVAASAAVNAAASAAAPAGDNTPWTWGRVFSSRIVWLLLAGRLITDPVWYFYQFWFAKYLHAARGVEQGQLTITWIIYAAAGVGSLAGGWLSGALVRRGVLPASSRLRVMVGCACLMPLSPVIASITGMTGTMVFASIAVVASLAFLINISSLVVDVVPKHSLGTVFSVVAAGSTVGGIIMNTLVARMVSGPTPAGGTAGFLDRGIQTVFGPVLDAVAGSGYGAWFVAMAFLHPLACLVLWLGGIHREGAGQRAT